MNTVLYVGQVLLLAYSCLSYPMKDFSSPTGAKEDFLGGEHGLGTDEQDNDSDDQKSNWFEMNMPKLATGDFKLPTGNPMGSASSQIPDFVKNFLGNTDISAGDSSDEGGNVDFGTSNFNFMTGDFKLPGNLEFNLGDFDVNELYASLSIKEDNSVDAPDVYWLNPIDEEENDDDKEGDASILLNPISEDDDSSKDENDGNQYLLTPVDEEKDESDDQKSYWFAENIPQSTTGNYDPESFDISEWIEKNIPANVEFDFDFETGDFSFGTGNSNLGTGNFDFTTGNVKLGDLEFNIGGFDFGRGTPNYQTGDVELPGNVELNLNDFDVNELYSSLSIKEDNSVDSPDIYWLNPIDEDDNDDDDTTLLLNPINAENDDSASTMKPIKKENDSGDQKPNWFEMNMPKLATGDFKPPTGNPTGSASSQIPDFVKNFLGNTDISAEGSNAEVGNVDFGTSNFNFMTGDFKLPGNLEFNLGDFDVNELYASLSIKEDDSVDAPDVYWLNPIDEEENDDDKEGEENTEEDNNNNEDNISLLNPIDEENDDSSEENTNWFSSNMPKFSADGVDFGTGSFDFGTGDFDFGNGNFDPSFFNVDLSDKKEQGPSGITCMKGTITKDLGTGEIWYDDIREKKCNYWASECGKQTTILSYPDKEVETITASCWNSQFDKFGEMFQSEQDNWVEEGATVISFKQESCKGSNCFDFSEYASQETLTCNKGLTVEDAASGEVLFSGSKVVQCKVHHFCETNTIQQFVKETDQTLVYKFSDCGDPMDSKYRGLNILPYIPPSTDDVARMQKCAEYSWGCTENYLGLCTCRREFDVSALVSLSEIEKETCQQDLCNE